MTAHLHDGIPLSLATDDQLVDELARRSRYGVLVVTVGEAARGDETENPVCSWRGGAVNALGMADFAKVHILAAGLSPRWVVAGDDEDDGEDEDADDDDDPADDWKRGGHVACEGYEGDSDNPSGPGEPGGPDENEDGRP